MNRKIPILLFGVLALGLLVWQRGSGGATPNTVLIVLDTVRSDRLSMCEDSRPTSPALEALAASENVAWTCDAVAPGSWTLPSHASFFTGVPVLEHGAHEITSGVNSFSGSSSRSRPLKDRLPTLAEEMADRGYQTIAISGNPVINESLGLSRGFDETVIADRFGNLAEDVLVQAVREQLESADSDQPLFLFVNIAEAHQRWTPVPAGFDWADEQSGELLKYAKLDESDPWRRYVEGKMTEAEVSEFNATIEDMYGYNVLRADQTLEKVLTLLESEGWCGEDCRLVITSDHGEMLGEHRLLDHGHYVWQSNTRVPFLVRGVEVMPEFTGPFNALHAFHLIRDGQLPSTLSVPSPVSWPHVRRCWHTRGEAFCATSAAIWDGTEKLVWMNDQSWEEPRTMRFDLVNDPNETNPLPLGDHPLSDALITLAEEVVADSAPGETVEVEVIEALRAAGYLD